MSKDAVKESLAGCLENAVQAPALGGIAMDVVWALAKLAPVDVVVDSWWFKPRDLAFARTGIARAGARRVVEVWCDIPADVARSRYVARGRPAIYRDRQRLAENWDDWAARATPLGMGPVLFVDTTQAIDHAVLASRVLAGRPLARSHHFETEPSGMSVRGGGTMAFTSGSRMPSENWNTL
ncbi:hypothetical protein [Nocardia sp. NPDC046763]|uniref:hypothetical protein n=1 Tax=Nocardia sp. NPDC046763 TaxID=3155256 RepID=UPI0033CC5C95